MKYSVHEIYNMFRGFQNYISHAHYAKPADLCAHAIRILITAITTRNNTLALLPPGCARQPRGKPIPLPGVDGGRKYTHGGATGYCRGLGGSWRPVSIEDGSESSFINGVIGGEGQAYIWTSGTKRGNGWVWGTGSPVSNINWSRTGFTRRPQPDNRDGNENCLAILNNFYPNDGITWHDVGCQHTKPVICES
nr:perlucin-like [Penaeus vannamei]